MNDQEGGSTLAQAARTNDAGHSEMKFEQIDVTHPPPYACWDQYLQRHTESEADTMTISQQGKTRPSASSTKVERTINQRKHGKCIE
ncbi:uncharacterized protein PITG_11228 [Phytophthora infestans T30-4]|uniref:Uncharacterized protein n=1 Tax=Phytophthora infestans (strain T30-4) TaxID=403677 RepID=D0NGH6_PHYIT|nr:uncharacterized protein PITG_11228 [Phytophthora infestans T30-4]EEY57377.1 hypothetical protein PITG_11228 [Phytophthora infestans T30-4]|eukprot:XP_002901987.1 hypothetical protein PITG_11228 [Phytophthora infestans T30-4]